ncbi:CGNR zinc finger domain-containing protein [uncultured Corynebacterium sp.]|uniref:CGNR zinc finger domain-containing protein n=1 Tax=uncultured Corynebacterium sp. TaxID=159447 RepID=UPI0025D6FC1F|nr:CGNR zinc finger domain-containing protein [uncultured Corynebacterium sp.]
MTFTHDVAPRMALIMDLVNTDPQIAGANQSRGEQQPYGAQPGGEERLCDTGRQGTTGQRSGTTRQCLGTIALYDVVESPEWLEQFIADHCVFRIGKGSVDTGRNVVRDIKALRAELRGIVDADDMESAVEGTNTLISVLSVRPYLSRHDDLDWHIDWEADNTDAVSRLRMEAGLGLLGFLPQGGVGRFKRCARPGCERYLVDLSKNMSRKFCEGTNCAARTHAQAYRDRNKRG